MLKISKLTDYATVVMTYLASHHGHVISATQLAQAIHLGVPTVSKVLKMLCESKLVISHRGTGGGYQLAKSAEKITIVEIVSAIEGNVAMTECCSLENTCSLDPLCALKGNWQIINRVVLQTLAGLTLADMAKPISLKQFNLHGIPVKVEGL